jgi:hypothetical protein
MENTKESLNKIVYNKANIEKAIKYLNKCGKEDTKDILSSLIHLHSEYTTTECNVREELVRFQDKCQHESYSVCGYAYCIKCGKLLEEL